eukprot:gene20478-24326_t
MVSQYLDQKGISYESINPFDQPEIALKYRIRSVPTVILLEKEEEIKRVIGFKPEEFKTGNVERFVHKIKALTGWEVLRITENIEIKKAGHLVTYTTRIGEVPDSTQAFLQRYADYVTTVSSSGNRNWGKNFAK